MSDPTAGEGLFTAAPQVEDWPEPRRDSPEREAPAPPRRRTATARAPASDGSEAQAGRRRRKIRMVFVVSAARSGSTLLRYLLDSHPEITAPAELNLSAYLQHSVSMWSRVEEARGELSDAEDGKAFEPSNTAVRKGRAAVDALVGGMVTDDRVSVFCDKSLTSVDSLDLLARCYPDASFVLLYRYPLDMISSGIEASRWGFNAYGFAPYLGTAPGNFVGGLGNYWIDRSAKMLEFERSCQLPHARLYYELLCGDPYGTLRGLFEFLGVRHDARTVKAVIRKALESEHASGPGDYKVDFTTTISRSSIGRGSLLPQMLAPPQVERIDQMLAELDYPSLETARSGDLAKLVGLRADPASSAEAEAKAAAAAFTARIDTGLSRRALSRDDLAQLPVEIVLTGAEGSQQLLVIEAAGVRDAGPADAVDRGGGVRLRFSVDGVDDALSGRANLAQLMHDGRIRVDSGAGEETRGLRLAARRAMLLLSSLLAED